MTIEELKADSNWLAAFSFASGEHCEGCESCGTPEPANPTSGVDTSPFTIDDVAEVLAARVDPGPEGCADTDVLGVFRLRDGRFAMIEACCDTTGWD